MYSGQVGMLGILSEYLTIRDLESASIFIPIALSMEVFGALMTDESPS
jgi:hypothetical protein